MSKMILTGIEARQKLKAGIDTPIDISSTDNNGAMTTTIKHADVAHTETSGESKTDQLELTFVSGVTVNAQGHVTNVQTTKYGILDTTYELSGAEVTATDDGSSVTIIHTLTASDNAESNSEVTVTSDTLSMAAGDKSYSIDIKWGSF